MTRKVSVTKRQTVFNDFFSIEEAILRFEKFDGSLSQEVRRLSFERGDSVAALIYDRRRERVILAEQFKYPTLRKTGGWITELVAGMVGHAESAETAMRREILEETGYHAPRLEPVTTFYVSPGGSSERIILFYAEVDETDRIGPGGGVSAEGEDIKLIEYSPESLRAAVVAGLIMDAKTIVAAMWLRDRLAG